MLGRPLLAGTAGSVASLAAAALFGQVLEWLRNRRVSRALGAGLDPVRTLGARLESVRALLATLASRDGETAIHCTRVARVADELADHLGTLGRGQRRDLRIACLLHDLGKLFVPLHVLRKAGSLDDHEWRQMRAHAADGARLARSAIAGASRVARIILQHHERLDGRGYPHGLPGHEILLEARIVAVADAFDAMICDRPYRRGMSVAAAVAELRRSAGQGERAELQFDLAVVEAVEARLPALCRLYRRQLEGRIGVVDRPAAVG